MIHPNIVDKQLRQIGANFKHWGRAEVKELPQILMEGERMQVAVMGRYAGGFAMLVTTDQRILLIDKKPLYLSLEDIRYDMVAEVDYRHQLIDATVHICTLNKQLRFTTIRKPDLRQLTNYIQLRVSELRQHQQALASMAQAGSQFYAGNPYTKAPLVVRRHFSPFGTVRS